MEYFRSGIKSVLGTPQQGEPPTGAATVERLVDRVISSTLLEDRRDACRALKALSRKFRVEVGAQGMEALRQVLEMDRADTEIISYCLDTLCNVTSSEQFDVEDQTTTVNISDIKVGEQFCEMFIKNPDNVGLVLSFLDEHDYRVRHPAIKLLTNLLNSRPREIQQIILESKLGVSKLMDLLVDGREVIRNTALLLFLQLTKGNANIQKIVAFENAFDRLFDIIMDEGGTDGGIVVEDCLLLMLNLLKNNTSNQNFFKEGSYIQKLATMFIIEDNQGWSPQKVSNMHCALLVVRTLVTPGSQKIMRSCGLLEALCNILMFSGVPADILTETINTVGDVVRGNLSNQEYFSNVVAPCTPPRPALIVLLMSMVNEKQPFSLRCSVLYSFECFLYKNEIGQSQVVQTLLPTNNQTTNVTSGQLLCTGLFSTDALSIWFATVALSHTLIDNTAQKEQMLRVLVATNGVNPPIQLLETCIHLLQETPKIQAKIGILILLSTWMSHCPSAVKIFLNVNGSMAFLIAQTSSNEHDDFEQLLQGLCAFLMGICVCFNDDSVHTFTIDNLCQLIERRIGIETYITKLSDVSKHELYSRSAKQTQIKCKAPEELVLDFEFCKLFKSLEGVIIKTVTRDLNNTNTENGLTELSLSAQENGLLLQYKELIREQDKKFKEVTQRCEELQNYNASLELKVAELTSKNQELQDQNILLQAQFNSNDDVDKIVIEKNELQEELERVKKDQEDLLELLSDQDLKLQLFKNRLRELNDDLVLENDSDDDLSERGD